MELDLPFEQKGRAMYRSFCGILLLLVGTGLVVAAGQPEPGSESAKGFMRAKLTQSQQILEGITLEDLASVARHAEQLKLLSFDANWQVLQTEDYARHSEDFRRAADYLAEAAAAKNLEAAVLAYFRLTQNCVDCHRHVRAQAK
jgi:hypothetical protein